MLKPKCSLNFYLFNASLVVVRNGSPTGTMPAAAFMEKHHLGGHHWHSWIHKRQPTSDKSGEWSQSVTESINKGQNQLGDNLSGFHKSF